MTDDLGLTPRQRALAERLHGKIAEVDGLDASDPGAVLDAIVEFTAFGWELDLAIPDDISEAANRLRKTAERIATVNRQSPEFAAAMFGLGQAWQLFKIYVGPEGSAIENARVSQLRAPDGPRNRAERTKADREDRDRELKDEVKRRLRGGSRNLEKVTAAIYDEQKDAPGALAYSTLRRKVSEAHTEWKREVRAR
jgi:hypothetical protein